MAITITHRYVVRTHYTANIEAYPDGTYVTVQQGEQQIQFQKAELDDLVEALTKAAAEVDEDSDVPF